MLAQRKQASILFFPVCSLMVASLHPRWKFTSSLRASFLPSDNILTVGSPSSFLKASSTSNGMSKISLQYTAAHCCSPTVVLISLVLELTPRLTACCNQEGLMMISVHGRDTPDAFLPVVEGSCGVCITAGMCRAWSLLAHTLSHSLLSSVSACSYTPSTTFHFPADGFQALLPPLTLNH